MWQQGPGRKPTTGSRDSKVPPKAISAYSAFLIPAVSQNYTSLSWNSGVIRTGISENSSVPSCQRVRPEAS